MTERGKQAAVMALFLGGLAVIAPTFLYGTTRPGGYGSLSGGYGGMMGSYSGIMGSYGGMMGGYGGLGGFGTGWTIFGLLSQLGFLLLLIGGGYLLYRTLVVDSGIDNFGTSETAMDELRRAYAHGEVSDDEFETRRKRLQREGNR